MDICTETTELVEKIWYVMVCIPLIFIICISWWAYLSSQGKRPE